MRSEYSHYRPSSIARQNPSAQPHQANPIATEPFHHLQALLSQISDEWQWIAVRFRKANGIRDGEKNDVFGSCVGEIDVSVEIVNRSVLLCCGRKYLGFILVGKVAQNRRCRWVMVPGIGSRLGLAWGG